MKRCICGLDVSSMMAHAALLGNDATRGRVLEVPATRAGEQALLEVLSPGSIVVMESTGRYHRRWARRLAAAGHEVYVLNALLAHRLATGSNALRENKTDPIDAEHLADIGRVHFGAIQTFRFEEDPALVRLLELCRVYRVQRQHLTALVSTANHYLLSMLPEAEALPLSFAQNQPLVDLFLEIDSLTRLRAMRRNTLARHLGTKTGAFVQMLHEPLNAAAVFDAMLPALQALLQLLEAFNHQLRALLVSIREAARHSGRQRQITLAQTIPGFGAKSTPAIIASLPPNCLHWGDKRTIARKLQAHFGFDPRLRTSGKWQGRVRMTKRGSSLARTALYQVAFCALRSDAELHACYDLLRAGGKHHHVAISHIMRRQLRRLVAVLVDDTPFVERPYTPPT